MENIDEINESYSSSLLDNLLKKIQPEEQEQIDFKMKLAAKIYEGLKAKGWKNADLANALNLKSASLVSKWLSGTHNFTVDTLVDIQRLLGIQLLNIELPKHTPAIFVNLTVSVQPASLSKEAYSNLQRVIDDSGGMQASSISVHY